MFRPIPVAGEHFDSYIDTSSPVVTINCRGKTAALIFDRK